VNEGALVYWGDVAPKGAGGGEIWKMTWQNGARPKGTERGGITNRNILLLMSQ